MHIKKLLSIVFREWPFLCIGVLLIFNVFLLCDLLKLRAENETWKRKNNLTIGEQLALMEHKLEGIDLRNDIDQLQRKNVHASQLLDNAEGYILLYLFKELTCDRCLNNKMMILNKNREISEKLGIDIIIVFTEITQEEYMSFAKLFRIKDISIREEGPVLAERFRGIRNPIILLLGHNRHILAASISDYYRDEYKSEKFYDKIKIFVQNMDYVN